MWLLMTWPPCAGASAHRPGRAPTARTPERSHIAELRLDLRQRRPDVLREIIPCSRAWRGLLVLHDLAAFLRCSLSLRATAASTASARFDACLHDITPRLVRAALQVHRVGRRRRPRHLVLPPLGASEDGRARGAAGDAHAIAPPLSSHHERNADRGHEKRLIGM